MAEAGQLLTSAKRCRPIGWTCTGSVARKTLSCGLLRLVMDVVQRYVAGRPARLPLEELADCGQAILEGVARSAQQLKHSFR